ncbi:MAG: hypothetical protein EZS28_048517, partial [Streblomastix strix]
MATVMTQDNGVEYFESIEVKLIALNVKYETLEKGSAHKYNRKSKKLDKAKTFIDQMIKQPIIELTIDQLIEDPIDKHMDQAIEQKNDK